MKASYFLLGLLFVAALVVRLEFYFYLQSQETLGLYVNQTVTVDGTVSDDIDARDSNVHVTIAVSQVNGKPASGTLIAFADPSTRVQYGDSVEIKGKLEAPQSFLTDTGRTFDYPNYLRISGISAVMSYATVEKSSPGGVSLYRELFALKHALENSLNAALSPQDSSLMQGILLGNRHALAADLEVGLVSAGLIHIVILAGYVLSLVADILARVAQKFLPRRAALITVGAFLILFVLMTGAAATTVRACIMALVALLARLLRRPGSGLRALVIAAAAMTLWNPLLPVYDESFIISVLATFGLVMCGNWVDQKLSFITEKYELRGIASSSLTVQLFALPALLYYTGTVSLVSVPANLLALPVLPFIMLAGCVTAFVGILPIVGNFFALVPALIAHVLLSWILFIVSVVEKIPFAALQAPPFPAWLAVLIYVPLIAAAIFVYSRSALLQLSS